MGGCWLGWPQGLDWDPHEEVCVRLFESPVFRRCSETARAPSRPVSLGFRGWDSGQKGGHFPRPRDGAQPGLLRSSWAGSFICMTKSGRLGRAPKPRFLPAPQGVAVLSWPSQGLSSQGNKESHEPKGSAGEPRTAGPVAAGYPVPGLTWVGDAHSAGHRSAGPCQPPARATAAR